MKHQWIRRFIILVLVLALLAGTVALAAGPYVIPPKQAMPSVAVSAPQGQTGSLVPVTFSLTLNSDMFINIWRDVKVTVSGQNCELLAVSAEGVSQIVWDRKNRPLEQKGAALETVFTATDFYDDLMEVDWYDDKKTWTVTGTAYARITGENAAVTVTAEDKESLPTGLPIVYKGNSEQAKLSRKSINGGADWLYIFERWDEDKKTYTEAMGLIVDKETAKVTHLLLCTVGDATQQRSIYSFELNANTMFKLVEYCLDSISPTDELHCYRADDTLNKLNSAPNIKETLTSTSNVSLDYILAYILAMEDGLNLLSIAPSIAGLLIGDGLYLPESTVLGMLRVGTASQTVVLQGTTTVPATGDSAPLALWLALAALSAAGAAVLLLRKRKAA